MKDYRDIMPKVPVIEGWCTTNHRDRGRNGEVSKMQGFVGVDHRGNPVEGYQRGWDSPETVDYVGVPEGEFHSDTHYWPYSRETAIRHALEHVQRLTDEANRILASIHRAMAQPDDGIEDAPAWR